MNLRKNILSVSDLCSQIPRTWLFFSRETLPCNSAQPTTHIQNRPDFPVNLEMPEPLQEQTSPEKHPPNFILSGFISWENKINHLLCPNYFLPPNIYSVF